MKQTHHDRFKNSFPTQAMTYGTQGYENMKYKDKHMSHGIGIYTPKKI